MSEDESNMSGDNEEDEENEKSGSGEGEEGEEGEEGSGEGEEGSGDDKSGNGEEEEEGEKGEEGSGEGSEEVEAPPEDDKTKKKKPFNGGLIQTNEVKIDITPFPINEPETTLTKAKSVLEMLQDVTKDLNEMFDNFKITIPNFGREKIFSNIGGYNSNYQFGGGNNILFLI